MQLSQNEREYLSRIKDLMWENLNTEGDISPHQMYDVMLVTNEYGSGVRDDVKERVIEDASWLIRYFARCRHCARPIDKVLAGNMIDNLGGFWLG